MTDSKNSSTFEKRTISLSENSILNFLDKKDLEPGEILEMHGLDTSYRSNLSNILRKMQDRKIVVKIGNKIHKIPIPESKLEEQIEEILVEDDCSLKNIDIINQKFNQKFKENISENNLSKILQTLRNKNKIFEQKKEFGIMHNELNKHNRCYLCKKELNDNQLIISMLFLDVQEIQRNFQIHALCRDLINKDNDIFWNSSSGDCDYCGLSLSVKHLVHKKPDNINLDKEIDTLFNEPFSKIFSSIDSSNYGDEVINVNSFACPKTENGNQYHPYCFDIIQKQKKGKKN